MKRLLSACVVASFLFSVQSFACGIEGTVVHKDGSKVDGTSTISTSWNSKVAYPRKGVYRLDLGSRVCGQKVTVYLDGNNSQRVRVDGWATVNYVRR